MQQTIPYTYLITEKETDKRYYGVRYRVGCCPADLGVTYFSSSKIVNQICRTDPNNFIFEVRQIFDNENVPLEIRRKQAKIWEAKVLNKFDAMHRNDWFNKHNANEKFLAQSPGYKRPPRSKEWARKIGLANKGKLVSQETREKLSKALKGRKFSEEHKRKISLSNKGKKLSEAHCQKMRDRRWSEETKAKIREARKHQIFTEETRKKFSEAAKGRIVTPGTRKKLSLANKGRVRTSEMRAKYSAAKLGKPLSEKARLAVIERNTGAKWYTDYRTNIFVRNNQTPPNGFVMGRFCPWRHKK